jgi:peptide/nickel transport system permease protein
VLVAGPIVALLLVAAALAPFLAPADPNVLNPRAKAQPPTFAHPLGTDEFGRDLWSRLLHGARITLVVGLSSVTVAAALGTLLGSAAAYARGPVEATIMRVMDGLLCFPPILLGIFVVTFLGPSLRNLILVIGVLYVPRFTRVVHASTLAIRELEYVESARALGASAIRVVAGTILPNIVAPILVQASLAAGHAILLESGLSFLGLGPPPPTPSWGRMVEQSGRFMQLSALPLLWPSAAISVTVLAFNLLGDGLRDLLDPRLRRGT